ncbi:MAG: VCBS repeat-containing protein [Pontiellaceae bacterium]|nr:VCBS repeat-containing protein [Pontiellaceae bacterium]
MKKSRVSKRFGWMFFGLLLVGQAGVNAQIPVPGGDPEPQVLVGILPGDVSVDNTGAASYNLSLTVPPGTSGVEPLLGISYNSRAGNGALGVGFSLSGISSVARMAPMREYEGFSGGVEFNDDDRLVLDGQRLLLVSTNAASYGTDGSEYRTEIESFQRVVLHGGVNTSNAWFEVRTKSGLIYEYGKTADSFVEPSNRVHALAWAVSRISDTAGNYMNFIYDEDTANGEHLLSRIEYTGNTNSSPSLVPYNTADFVYTNRPDVRYRYHEGAQFNTTKRLSKIEFRVEGELSHEYRFEYVQGETGLSQLHSIQEFFANGDSVPATVFEWTDADGTPGFAANSGYEPPVEITGTDGEDKGVRFMDLNGDGLIDLVYHNGTTGGAYLNSGNGWISAAAYAPPFGIADPGNKDRISFSDVNGDGLPDMFYNHLDGTTTNSGAYLNTGSGWATNSSPEFVPPMPVSYEGEEYTGVELVDFNSDGIPDLYYHRFRNYVLEHGKWLGATNGWLQTTLYSEFQVQNDGGTDGGSRFLDVDGNRSLDELYAGAQWFSFCRPANPFGGGSITIGGAYNPPYDFIDDSDKSTGVHLVDVNGDGLPDFLYHRKLANGTVEKGAFLNTGTGWATSSNTNFVPPIILKQDNAAAKGVLFIDVNGDGLVDIVRNNSSIADAWINTGTGWLQDNSYAPPQAIVASDGKDKGTRFVDVNGDGLLDLVSRSGSSQGAWINQSRPPMLKKVIVGQREGGAYATATEIYYSPLTDTNVYTKGSGAQFPSYDIQGPMLVVSEMAKEDGLGGKYWSMYTYANGRNHRDRGFLGFQIFESYDPQTKISQIDYLAQDFPLTGVPLKTETRYIPDPSGNPDGQLLKEVENNWLYHLVWTGEYMTYYSYFHYAVKSTERKWELGNTNDVVSSVTTYNWFDGQDTSGDVPNLVQYTNSFPIEIWYGDISKISIDYGDGNKQITESSWLADSSNWLLGRLWQSTNTFISGTNQSVRTASFDYYNGTGLLALEVTEPNSGKWLQTDYDYDAFGNITNKTVSGADISTRSPQQTKYDSKGRFVVESKNALDHKETMVADPVTGLLESRTGPNGLPTSWRYDSLGRPKLETRADNTTTTTTYAWETGVTVSTPLEPGGSNVTVAAAWSVSTQSSGTAPTKAYFDRQGREIRTVTEAPDGRLVYQDVGRNSLGQTVSASDPYFSGDSPNFGFTQYDELGRLKLVITPDGTQTAYGYQGLVSSITNNYGAQDGADNSKDQVTTTYKNAKGEVLKVVDNLGYKIQYQYDAAGNLVKTIDEANNEVVMEYDIRGNKIRQDDPDMGEWFYGYNALGQLVAQTNANSQVTSMEYDLLGRMTKRISPEGTAQWFYDGDSEGCWLGAMRREEMSDATGTNLVYRRTHAYDALGRPLLSLYSVDNKWYYTCNEYDGYSRVKSTHRFWRPKELQGPEHNLDHRWNSFASINTYNERGIVTKVEDGSGHVWWEMDAADFDAKGHRLEYTLGNDIVTSQTFDPDSGRLETIQLSNMSNGLHNYGFEFDRLGNLTQRSLARTLQTTRSEDFTYDKLNRLESSTVGSTVSSASYDAIGNIQTKTGVSGTYQYGGGSAGPHGVSSADGVTYTYDNCGNMLGRYMGGTNISSTAWTSFNKPSTMYNIHDGSEFTYDANQNRMIQIGFEDGAGTKKLYLDGFEQEETLTGGNQYDRPNWQWSLKETRVFVSTPSGVVGVHIQDAYENVERRYFHYDHLGSVVAVSGEGSGGNASLIAEYSYDSWGKRRDASTWQAASVDTSSLKTDRGFTGHEMLDNIGLVHMNGRIYDPHLGRFLSADPIVQAPGDLQSYNRYSYVRNNPLTYTDPSGYSWLSKQWKRVRNAVSDAWNDIVEFHEKYWEAIVVTVIAVAVTILTAGLAAPAVGGIVSGVWGSVITGAIAGAAGGFAAGFSGTLLYGGSLSDAFENGLTGALWGGVSGAIAGGIGYYAKLYDWTAKAKALAHGLRGGVVSLAKGDSVEAGFLSGAGGGFFQGTGAAALIGASLVGGTASVIAGGKFASGAITAAFAVIAAGIGARFAAQLEPQGARGPYPTSYPNDDSLVDYLKAGWRKISTWWAGDPPPEQAWNPTGRATVWKGGKFGGYVLAGGEAGRVTLKFDNGYLQDYGYVGGGVGLGGFACGADMCGVVYGVYEPSDYAGYFINIDLSAGGGGSFSYWQSVGGVSGGMASPGISGAFQGYWTIGKPYKAP